MIALESLRAQASTFHALQTLSPELLELAAGELSPSEQLLAAEQVQLGSELGALLAINTRLIAVYSTKMLFKRFPTIQTMDYPHVQRAQVQGVQVYVYASPHPGGSKDEYEENTFVFRAPETAEGFVQFLRGRCPQLQQG